MNITQSVASSIEGVEFGILSASEIRSLSVKRIYDSQALDRLGHPKPGGLYDTALGAYLDHP